MSPAAGKCGSGLHEIKNAFRLAMFFVQNGFDDVQGSDRHRGRPASVPEKRLAVPTRRYRPCWAQQICNLRATYSPDM